MKVTLKQHIDENTEIEKKTNMEVIKLMGIGKNATKKVEFDNNSIGFYKNSALTTNAALDDFEYFISIMGRDILGFDLASVSRVYDEKGECIGIISENVAKENERLMMFSDVLDILTQNPSNELAATAINIKKIKERTMATLPNPNGENRMFATLYEEQDIAQIINMFSIALDNLNVSTEEKDGMMHKYFEMIVLDTLIGQKDRNNDNYGILYDEQTKMTRFSPLFDNSTIHFPGIPDNFCQLNGCLIDKEKLMGVLVTNYPEYTLNIINPIVDKKEEFLLRAQTLSHKVLNEGQAHMIMGRLTENITAFEKITKENTAKK